MSEQLTVWCNTTLPPDAIEQLRDGLAPHRLLLSQKQTYNLGVSEGDPALEQAEVAFGQPNPQQVMKLGKLRWVHLTTAGFTRYDRDDLRQAMRQRHAIMTNSSTVYAEPCAQHAVAFMMALARCLPDAMENQRTDRRWIAKDLRARNQLLCDQTALIVGFGAIGRRIAELLAPYRMNLIAVRRKPRGDEPVRTVAESQIEDFLPTADHVIDVLPDSNSTNGFFNVDRLKLFKSSAHFYNIGRGSTVDQDVLAAMLQSGCLAAAYLDVMTPEPLPPDHPLWTTPRCYITPHTAGGHGGEFKSLVAHFLDNFHRFIHREPMLDQII